MHSEFAYRVLRSLRTSSIAAIVDLLTPLLHIDPVAKLPPEITSLVFSYLPPRVLLGAASVSRAWRERALDSALWKEKYLAEGWTLDPTEIRDFEENFKIIDSHTKGKARKADSQDGERFQKRRAQDPDVALDSQPSWVATASAFIESESAFASMSSKTKSGQEPSQDQEMRDADSALAGPSVLGQALTTEPARDTSMSSKSISPSQGSEDLRHYSWKKSSSDGSLTFDLTLNDPLVVPTSPDTARLNYHHIYKQKRRLEENWIRGRYKSFQLPHRDHAEEAHNECVYTVQYSGKYLVSGSRDKTLRIWDLDTQRLVKRPLSGHKGSVLCLQFDASPEEDIIISGSSDTNVIIWQFSTGKILRTLEKAHNESVLNLKFDHRFLVTCSKDKMIKVWNRKQLRPGHKDYPIRGMDGGAQFPSYVVDLASLPDPKDFERYLTPEQLEPIPEYSLVMKIDSHHAAVNAVHIFKDKLVSASGDRFIKVFDIHTGVSTALCSGHHKGIACVQFDGKRIVSGSSDDTIRIFDPVSQAEVACLEGHKKLVRTIQASFGDCPGTTAAELEKEARQSDRAYFEALLAGKIAASAENVRRRGQRSAGVRPPHDVASRGARLPPGGGGHPRWARIVSGSYDETVIVWRKAPDGRWVEAHTLKQAEALRAAGAPLLPQSERREHGHPRLAGHGRVPRAVAVQLHLQAQQQAQQVHQYAQQAQQALAQAGAQAGAGAAAPNTTPGVGAAGTPSYPLVNPIPNLPPSHPIFQTLPTNAPTPQQIAAATANAHVSFILSPEAPPQGIPALMMITQASGTQSAPAPALAQQIVQHHAQQAAQQAAQQQAAATGGPGAPPMANPPVAPPQNARVFKLQFDARRIICCSQDPKIVGWDFANGDEDIATASRFFGAPA